MFGRENVIKAIEHHIAERGYCRDCIYEESYAPNGDCGIFVDALALLREQEPVKPITAREGRNKYWSYYICPSCNDDLNYGQNIVLSVEGR